MAPRSTEREKALTSSYHVFDDLAVRARFHEALGHEVQADLLKASCSCGWQAHIWAELAEDPLEKPVAYRLAEVPARLPVPVTA